MHLKLFQKRTTLKHAPGLQLLIQAFIILFACSLSSQGQRPGPRQPLPDMVRAIERKEMDRLLLLKPITASKDDSARRAVLKQIGDDFRDMQRLNNKMMADAWAREELDYRYISGMISQIRGKAVRLKSNLSLPEPQGEKNKQIDSGIPTPKEFREELLQLDRLIMSFATNPLFQKPDVVEVDLANRASSDLASVIDQSGRLKKIAGKLSKPPKISQ